MLWAHLVMVVPDKCPHCPWGCSTRSAHRPHPRDGSGSENSPGTTLWKSRVCSEAGQVRSWITPETAGHGLLPVLLTCCAGALVQLSASPCTTLRSSMEHSPVCCIGSAAVLRFQLCSLPLPNPWAVHALDCPPQHVVLHIWGSRSSDSFESIGVWDRRWLQ